MLVQTPSWEIFGKNGDTFYIQNTAFLRKNDRKKYLLNSKTT